MNVLGALSAADRGFDRRLREVGESDWHRPTPCTDWDTYRLVNHVVIGGGRYGRLVRGGTREDFLAERQIDALVTGALPAWEENRSLCAAAFAEPGALERIVPFSTGDIPGRILLQIRVVEVVVHTWDLARALGLDESCEPDLAAFALRVWPENALPLGFGGVPFFDPPAPGDAPGSDLETLLRLAGRTP
ncbi:TIGR03086 family metal-binding protein [Sporichthya polymorpha]|uniref:TIGR03086 family metal-binding protein n=1 Tax=Sporichthya polymorpha TaxID=35751 RepID=UPI000374465F|nr:TIGR03086 family metal-binding protein [Sporichthya polymorpha]